MVSFNIGSLNINGYRDVRKGATLFKYLQLEKADVILLQETHTDACNETDWINEWEGSISLSHGTNVSAGVAFLFSKRVKIIVSAISFYDKLYQSELCDEAAVEELLLDLPQLSKEENMELEEFLTFSELSSAVQGLNSGKSLGVNGLSAEFF